MGLLLNPKVLPFVAVPLLINAVLFGAGFYYGYEWAQAQAAQYIAALPSWLQWLEWLVGPLFVVMFLLFLFYGFTVLANLIGAPFNSVLAARVEALLTGTEPGDDATFAQALKSAPGAILDELGKILYMLRWVIPLAILTLIGLFIPFLSPLAALAWLLFGAWMLAVEYGDFPMGNHGYKGKQMRRILRASWMNSMGFGGAALVMTLIPGLNLIAMPASVAGATAMWAQGLAQSSAARKDIAA
ncbi:putative CysZ protein [Magnetofaba australis IT-1]|uniref:Putative CysZ protein n=2 Tax=Magnetofaba TaxID=1472292 RepID=A0A1Y2K3Q8_9PROT|nr:putative CysZ protein [Magnetofaba australis IT-1]